jgi:2'-5' RNA ligase
MEIDSKLALVGVPKEKKSFHPHVTLARVKRGVADVTALARNARDYGSFEFDGFSLIKSTLTREGPVYEELKRYEVIK